MVFLYVSVELAPIVLSAVIMLPLVPVYALKYALLSADGAELLTASQGVSKRAFSAALLLVKPGSMELSARL